MNLNPIAVNDAFALDSDGIAAGNIVANDDPTDGPTFFLSRINDVSIDPIATTNVSLASGAKVSINAVGNFVYNPDSAFDGNAFIGPTALDKFSYAVSDGAGGEATATVSFTINRASRGSVEVTGTGEGETVIGGDLSERVSGLGGNDTITAGAGDDTVSTGSGNDVSDGGAGDDLMLGGGLNADAIDAIYKSAKVAFPDRLREVVVFQAGDSTISVSEDVGSDVQNGGDGDDTIVDLAGANELKGGAGSDQIVDGNGDSSLSGGDGDDGLLGGGGADLVMAGDGNDFGAGDQGDDRITAKSGVNILDGGEGDDTIVGGTGNDLVVGGLGDDSIFGGTGDDVLAGGGSFTSFFAQDDVNVSIRLSNLEASAFDFADLKRLGLVVSPTLEPFSNFAAFSDVETLSRQLTLGDKTLSQDTLFGGDGNDFLHAGAGAGVLFGGKGNDILGSANGTDILKGGSGQDSLFGGDGGDMLLGGRGQDALLGGGGGDDLMGGGGADFLSGQGGRDTLHGGGGKDNLNGGGREDSLLGGGGADVMDGGGGRDTVNGGGGRDQLTGGRGADVFEFSIGDGRDSITDFEQNRDKIQITNGAAEFSDMSLVQAGKNVLIGFSNVRVLVENQNVVDFDANDFMFGG